MDQLAGGLGEETAQLRESRLTVGFQQCRPVWKMPVDGRKRHADSIGDGAHGESIRAGGIAQPCRGGEDLAAELIAKAAFLAGSWQRFQINELVHAQPYARRGTEKTWRLLKSVMRSGKTPKSNRRSRAWAGNRIRVGVRRASMAPTMTAAAASPSGAPTQKPFAAVA